MEHDFLINDLVEAVSWFDYVFQQRLGELNRPYVSRTQATLLVHIAKGEKRPTRLAKKVGLTKQAVSNALADLEQRGMLAFSPDPEDRRAVVVEFAPGLDQYRADTAAIHREIEAMLTQVWGEAKFKAVRKAMAIDWRALPPHWDGRGLPRKFSGGK